MHWSLRGLSYLGQAKLVNCSQILGYVPRSGLYRIDLLEDYSFFHLYLDVQTRGFNACQSLKSAVTHWNPGI